MTTGKSMFPRIGFGLGLRPPHYGYIFDNKPDVDWFEIITENYMDTDGRPRRMLDRVLEHYPVVMHGVSLSIGTVDPLNSEYLAGVKKLAAHVNPPWISDHLCWTGIAHKNTHDLLPVPYTEQALKHITQRIREVQDFLERPIVLENPSTYLEFTSSTMPEWEFIARMAEDSGCGLLLDANNVYVSCYNHKWDPQTYIDALPLDRVAQIHLAGHTNKGTHIVDTHDDHVVDEVWALYRYIIGKAGRISTMIEWDDKIPDFPVVMDELDKARKWARTDAPQPELPRFEALRRNVQPRLTPVEDDMHALQEAIFTGQAARMNPDEAIIPKPGFTPEEQALVYINGYRYRLFDVVYDEFPALRAYLGREEFARLVNDYIAATKPQSHTVSRYIDRFAAFVAAAGHDGFARELAVLETHIARLFDAEETRALVQGDIAHLTPDLLMQGRLSPRAALVLLAFANDVNGFYTQAVTEEMEAPVAEKDTPGFVAVYRHEDRMHRLALEEGEYLLLSSLFSGQCVGRALESFDGGDEDELAVNLSTWFSRWINNGLLQGFSGPA